MTEHVLQQHSQNPFFCNLQCGKRFSTFLELRKHRTAFRHYNKVTSHHNVYCKHCDKEFAFFKWCKDFHIRRHFELRHISIDEALDLAYLVPLLCAPRGNAWTKVTLADGEEKEDSAQLFAGTSPDPPVLPNLPSVTNQPNYGQMEAQARQDHQEDDPLPPIRAILGRFMKGQSIRYHF